MEKVLVFSLLVLASLRSASTEEMFIKEGGKVTLNLRPAPSDPITVIQWKFQDLILAEWVKDVLPLTHNRNNIKLDIVSGRLDMEKMTKEEAGVYSVEVNNNVQKVTYNVLVIKDVPKPEIWVAPLTCSHEDDQCTLSCEGNTTGAEPVTYSWKTGDGEWKESRRDMPITKKEHGDVKNFTCKMKNPVSEKESDPVPNKLYKKEEEPKPSPVGGIVGGIFGAILVVAAGIGSYWGWKNDKCPCGKRNVVLAENGDAPAYKAEGEVTTKLVNASSTANTSPDEQPGSGGGPAGGVADPLLKEKPPGSQEEPADPPPNTPHEKNTDIEDAAAKGEADAKLDTELDTELDAKL